MRDVDNNLSAVIIEPSSSTSCDNSNQNAMINHTQNAGATELFTDYSSNYSLLRDRLWEVIDKEICMSQCDIYR